MKTIRFEHSEFEGRNNAYLLECGSDLVLVDTGWATEQEQGTLVDGLARHGYACADVDAILLTHWHIDHAGLAGFVQERSGATVYAHASDAALVRQEPDAVRTYRTEQLQRFRQWGIPEKELDEVAGRIQELWGIAGEPPAVESLKDGQLLHFDGGVLETIHTPGHTAGHCCYSFQRDGTESAFVGDALLPVYTPNVGGTDVRLTRPLEQYLDTLQALADRQLDRAVPGHRDVITVPTERATAIISHLRERTHRVLEILEDAGPANVWTVSKQLFGDLDGVHVAHGAGEAFAHLDHLHHTGVVAESAGTYRLVEADPDLDTIVAQRS